MGKGRGVGVCLCRAEVVNPFHASDLFYPPWRPPRRPIEAATPGRNLTDTPLGSGRLTCDRTFVHVLGRRSALLICDVLYGSRTKANYTAWDGCDAAWPWLECVSVSLWAIPHTAHVTVTGDGTGQGTLVLSWLCSALSAWPHSRSASAERLQRDGAMAGYSGFVRA